MVLIMRRYFFHLQGSGARDLDGQEFPTDEAARQEAKAVAADVSKDRKSTTAERLTVTDADGKVMHEEPLVRGR